MEDKHKGHRRAALRVLVGSVGLAVIYVFVAFAKPLLFPVLTAFVCAYLFKPLIHTARLKGIPRSASVCIIAFSLLGGIFYSVKVIEKSWPTGFDRVQKQVRVQYQLNEKIARLLKVKDGPEAASPIYKNLHKEIDSLSAEQNGAFKLPASTKSEQPGPDHSQVGQGRKFIGGDVADVRHRNTQHNKNPDCCQHVPEVLEHRIE